MTEAKVLEKIRKTLIASATIKAIVQDRVYTEHISSIKDPIYPAISIMLMPGQARTNVPDMVNMVFQLDLWFPVDSFDADQVLECYGTIRGLLHNQNLSDTAIGVKIMTIKESGVGPLLFDQDISGHHLPARYSVVAI